MATQTNLTPVLGYLEPYSGPPEQYMNAMHLHTCKQNMNVHEAIKHLNKLTKNDRTFFLLLCETAKENLGSLGTKESK